MPSLPDSRAASSKRIEECDQIGFLLIRQSHAESPIVEVHGLVERAGGAIVEVGRTGCQPAEDRALDAVEVSTFAANQRLAWIGGVEGLWLAAREGCRAS